MSATVRPLRFGLAGTGYWASITHAPALASTPGVEFAAVWGRNAGATAAIAAEYDITAHDDVDAFLADVDAVAFSVPPQVQTTLAVRAARAGKHLLLEKPIATSESAADALARSVGEAGVASVVFFTARFQPEVRAWLADVTRQGGWSGGCAVWLGTALLASSPFNTPWRNDKGGLWDLGPHVVSLLWAALGPVRSVTADGGPADVAHLVLHHESGATSTVTVTLSASEAAECFELYVWGTPGRSAVPPETERPVTALRTALTELSENARSGRLEHPCDVRFGRDVGRVLAQAERQIGARLP
ncbi:MAG TPA: Gfo/Idh/MocA family oxidoreductase [Streptosporangiaceae bacterium]|nr:Gfo/Idh/MocA family oxidoreductase [Streptosporangiaceae bacterium]